MAQSNPNLTAIFTDVANAIRAKTGSNSLIHPVDFADEIDSITGGGAQLYAPTISLGTQSYSQDVLNIANNANNGSFCDHYAIYADGVLKGSVTSTTVDLRTLISVAGTYAITAKCTGTGMTDSNASNSINYVYYDYATVTNTLVNCTTNNSDTHARIGQPYSATISPASGYSLVDAIVSITMNGVDISSSYDNGAISIASVTGALVISIDCETIATNYVIGFSGMSQSTPALVRTDSAVGATWAASSGVIAVTGIDMSKIWGGYEDDNGNPVTYENGGWVKNGAAYSGNVFSKINKFYVKASYDNGVLDGYQLCFGNKPDNTWSDWFNGKDSVGIGCYKARNGDGTSALSSVTGVSYASSSADSIVASYKIADATGALHAKWFNENAILQVLFMAIFATRQTEDVFPQGTYRNYNDSKQTGYMDSMRTSSAIATGYTTSYSSGANGNMFLGIEDFVGFGYELVAGVVMSGTQPYATFDYANFSYSGSYSAASINLSSFTSGQYIKELQEDSTFAGLLMPKVGTGDTSTATDYFCDKCWTGQNCWYQGAYFPDSTFGVFFAYLNYSSSSSSTGIAARLCR